MIAPFTAEEEIALQRELGHYRRLLDDQEELQKIRNLFGLEFDKRPLLECIVDALRALKDEQERRTECRCERAYNHGYDTGRERGLEECAVLERDRL